MGDLVLAALATILQKFFATFATWMIKIMAGLQSQGFTLADSKATQDVLKIVIPIALVLLMLRLGYGLLHDYMLWDSAGTNTTPTNLVKGAALAAAGMAMSTLLVKSVWGFFAQMSLAFAGLGIYSHGATVLNGAIAAVIAVEAQLGGVMFILVLLEYAAALIVLLICVFQTFVRIADMALYLVAGPLAAIGLVSRNQGSWAGWWKGIIVIAGSQSAQLFLIYFGFSALAGMGIVAVGPHHELHVSISTLMTAPLLMIGALLASLKGADFIKQMGGYSTGVGSMVSTQMGNRFGK